MDIFLHKEIKKVARRTFLNHGLEAAIEVEPQPDIDEDIKDFAITIPSGLYDYKEFRVIARRAIAAMGILERPDHMETGRKNIIELFGKNNGPQSDKENASVHFRETTVKKS